MSLYALVQNGVVLEYRTVAPNVNQSLLKSGKPRLLPVVVENDTYNPITQVREEPYAVIIQATQVIHSYTVRAKTTEEVAAMAAAKAAAISDEFQRLCQLPITFTVGNQDYIWDADQEAIRNVTGALQSYTEASAINIILADPRNWTPVDSFQPITLTRNQLRGLGLAIAARKDALFFKKKTKQAAVLALSDPTTIYAYDITTGWDD